MKINVDYLQEVLPYVVNNIFEDRVLDNLLKALKLYKDDHDTVLNPEEYGGYFGTASDFLQNSITFLFMNRYICIHEDTVLDVGDDESESQQLNRLMHFRIQEIFTKEEILSDYFFVVENDKLVISEAFVDQIVDAVSDTTGFLVESLSYSIE